MTYQNKSFSGVAEEPEEYHSPMVLLVSFTQFTADRPQHQPWHTDDEAGSVGLPDQGGRHHSSSEQQHGLARDSPREADSERLHDRASHNPPGEVRVTAFINRYLNTEDACVVSKEWAESGAMSWAGYINYILPEKVCHIRIDMVFKDEWWWKPAMEGTVVDLRMSRTGESYAVIHRASKSITVGDKIGGRHGVKVHGGRRVVVLADAHDNGGERWHLF